MILGIALVPMLALLVQNGYDLAQSKDQLTNMQTIQEHVMLNMKIGTIVHYIQLERGTSALYLSSKENPEVFRQVRQFRLMLDLAIQNMETWTWTLPEVRLEVLSEGSGEVTIVDFSSRESFASGIKQFRSVVSLGAVNVTEVLSFYSALNVQLTNWMVSGMLSSYSASRWSMLVAFHMLIIAKEQAGVERAFGTTFYAQVKKYQSYFELSQLLQEFGFEQDITCPNVNFLTLASTA
ncbi:hypothetical protein ACOMHN_067243 [Nucella lapillus]